MSLALLTSLASLDSGQSMNIANCPTSNGMPARPRPRPNRPLPLDQFDNYGDEPPEGMELDDVELIWWAVASRTSKKELRAKLAKVVRDYSRPFDCFSYKPISDAKGRGRYPRAVILAIKQTLKPHGAIGASNDVLYIQVSIWHAMTEAAFRWLPAKSLPMHLRTMKLETELGL